MFTNKASRYPLEPKEVVLCMQVINLEVSEITHKRKPLLCVGTAIIQGEDLATKGNMYIFDVIDVVPEPDQPSTAQKLKLIAKEEVKGAVSAVSELGSEGFLLMAQGQKCMVRGLKEDGTLLPVAFMDVQTYVTVAKGLKGTGMCLLGDVAKGVWFAGYTVSLSTFLCEPFNIGNRRTRTACLSSVKVVHEWK
jgi:cleavage and polyadenylation specificity factor subunit 1